METIQQKKISLKEEMEELLEDVSPNLKYFCKGVRRELRNERDNVTAITGYPGAGKSQLGAIMGILVDFKYDFKKNICFIPTAKEIEKTYMELPMYSVLHIDEASRGLHKQKWYDKVQQKLNQLYDTERENHFLCSLILMPRFQNFTENFRNFRIKYWVNIVDRGLGIAYKRDEDKDAKDPWHIDESYKMKLKKWRGRKIHERDVASIVKMEQLTPNYWFYFKIPEIPKEIWNSYQALKLESREINTEGAEDGYETYRERLSREKMDKWNKIRELKKRGIETAPAQAIHLGCSEGTIRSAWREMREYEKMKGREMPNTPPNYIAKDSIYSIKPTKDDNLDKEPEVRNKEPFVLPKNETME